MESTANMPTELANAVDAVRTKMIRDCYPVEEAERVAMRTAQHAGWFNTVGGWKRLAPDLRKKIALRKAEKQPDGRYLIQDVDVFYPNAVKTDSDGNPIHFDADRIRRCIANTEAYASTGGQKPAIVRMHPNPMQKALGTILPIYGNAFNWRETPGKPGWARCDLCDVSPDLVDEWRKGQITGLSAGFAEDGGKLAERFGHVAALGAETQALTHLPTTEIFSVADGTLCFSAEPVGSKGTIYMDPKKAKAMSDCYAAMSSAYAACATGEPGAADKLSQAQSGYAACMKQYEAGSGDQLSDESSEGAGMPGGSFESSGPSKETELPENPELTPQGNVNRDTVLPAATFSTADVTNLRSTLKQMQNMNALLLGKQIKMEFSASVKEMIDAGHQFTSDQATEMFAAAGGNSKMVEQALKLLAATPKRESLSAVGTVFGAAGTTSLNGGGPVNGNGNARKLDMKSPEFLKAYAEARRASRSDFTAEEFALGFNALCE